MPNLLLLFLNAVVSPVLLIGFLVVALFAIAGVDGVPIARMLLKLFFDLTVGIVSWFFRVVLTLLSLALPALRPILQPDCTKTRGKSK